MVWYVQGSLPVEWGIDATFPKLRNLSLSFNSLLGGTLPSQWGSDGSSLKGLAKLEINNCHVTGTLPDAWAQNLPSLKDVNVSTNALTGEPLPGSFRYNAWVILEASAPNAPLACVLLQGGCATQGLYPHHGAR